jgi:hypothetical protein
VAAQVALAADDYREGATDRAGLTARLRRDSASPRPTLRVRAWQIRVDRDGAEVGEDYEEAGPGTDAGREAGSGPGTGGTGAGTGAGREAGREAEQDGGDDVRPFRARYRLERRGERWVFAAGL